MTREQITAVRQYARQATFLAMRKRTTEAMELIFFKAKNDSDITPEAYSILSAICDGISDYTDLHKS